MKIQIARVDDCLATSEDYRDIKDQAEIAQIVMELERIKIKLINLYSKMPSQ